MPTSGFFDSRREVYSFPEFVRATKREFTDIRSMLASANFGGGGGLTTETDPQFNDWLTNTYRAGETASAVGDRVDDLFNDSLTEDIWNPTTGFPGRERLDGTQFPNLPVMTTWGDVQINRYFVRTHETRLDDLLYLLHATDGDGSNYPGESDPLVDVIYGFPNHAGDTDKAGFLQRIVALEFLLGIRNHSNAHSWWTGIRERLKGTAGFTEAANQTIDERLTTLENTPAIDTSAFATDTEFATLQSQVNTIQGNLGVFQQATTLYRAGIAAQLGSPPSGTTDTIWDLVTGTDDDTLGGRITNLSNLVGTLDTSGTTTFPYGSTSTVWNAIRQIWLDVAEAIDEDENYATTNLPTRILNTQNQLDQLEDRMEGSGATTHESLLAGLRSDFTDLNNTVASAINVNNTQATQITNLTTLVGNHRTDYITTRDLVGARPMTITDTVWERFTFVENHIGADRASIVALQNRATAIESTNANLSSDIGALNVTTDNHNTRITTNTTNIANNTTDIASVRSDVNAITADAASVPALAVRVTNNEGLLAGLRTDVDQNETDITTLEGLVGTRTGGLTVTLWQYLTQANQPFQTLRTQVGTPTRSGNVWSNIQTLFVAIGSTANNVSTLQALVGTQPGSVTADIWEYLTDANQPFQTLESLVGDRPSNRSGSVWANINTALTNAATNATTIGTVQSDITAINQALGTRPNALVGFTLWGIADVLNSRSLATQIVASSTNIRVGQRPSGYSANQGVWALVGPRPTSLSTGTIWDNISTISTRSIQNETRIGFGDRPTNNSNNLWEEAVRLAGLISDARFGTAPSGGATIWGILNPLSTQTGTRPSALNTATAWSWISTHESEITVLQGLVGSRPGGVANTVDLWERTSSQATEITDLTTMMSDLTTLVGTRPTDNTNSVWEEIASVRSVISMTDTGALRTDLDDLIDVVGSRPPFAGTGTPQTGSLWTVVGGAYGRIGALEAVVTVSGGLRDSVGTRPSRTSPLPSNLWGSVTRIEGILGTAGTGQSGTLYELIAEAAATGALDDGSVLTAHLANDAVTTDKIANDAIVAALIADGAVGTDQLASRSVTTSKLPTASALGIYLSAQFAPPHSHPYAPIHNHPYAPLTHAHPYAESSHTHPYADPNHTHNYAAPHSHPYARVDSAGRLVASAIPLSGINQSAVTGLASALATKSNISHSHPFVQHTHGGGGITTPISVNNVPTLPQSKIAGLVNALAGKASTTHTHPAGSHTHSQYALASALTALTERVSTLEGEVDTLQSQIGSDGGGQPGQGGSIIFTGVSARAWIWLSMPTVLDEYTDQPTTIWDFIYSFSITNGHSEDYSENLAWDALSLVGPNVLSYLRVREDVMVAQINSISNARISFGSTFIDVGVNTLGATPLGVTNNFFINRVGGSGIGSGGTLSTVGGSVVIQSYNSANATTAANLFVSTTNTNTLYGLLYTRARQAGRSHNYATTLASGANNIAINTLRGVISLFDNDIATTLGAIDSEFRDPLPNATVRFGSQTVNIGLRLSLSSAPYTLGTLRWVFS